MNSESPADVADVATVQVSTVGRRPTLGTRRFVKQSASQYARAAWRWVSRSSPALLDSNEDSKGDDNSNN